MWYTGLPVSGTHPDSHIKSKDQEWTWQTIVIWFEICYNESTEKNQESTGREALNLTGGIQK